jgi:phasin family protein
MPKNVYEIQKENMDAAMKSFGAMSKAFQAIAVEFANYSKRSLEDHTAAAEKLMGAKSLEKAFEVQTEYVKTAYEGFIAHTTKVSELYADLAKELYKPIEGVIGSGSRIRNG